MAGVFARAQEIRSLEAKLAALLSFISSSRPIVCAVAVALVLGCLATNAPRTARAASAVAPDPALTQRLLGVDANASPPPARNDDFLGIMNAPRATRGTVSGRVVWRTPHGDAPARGLRVFLMGLDDYTAWFAALSSANALANKDAVASLDYGVRYRALFSTTADRNGMFAFPARAPGQYILFAVLHETIGDASPTEQVERGWDARGHGADVTVPSIQIPVSHLVSFRYLYGFDLREELRPWNLGTVRANTALRDGQPPPAAAR